MNTNWTDELKEKAVALYKELNPTSETTIECLAEVATALDKTPNSVRMILSKAGAYVKKDPASATKSTGTKRVSKQDALNELHAALSDSGVEIDSTITEKLTGKASSYFTNVIRQILDSTE